MACGFYCLMVAALLKGSTPLNAYSYAIEIGMETYRRPPYTAELAHFARFVTGKIHELPESQIESSGYVIHTLETSVWCLLSSSSYEEAVLKAVNLGGDTDTTGCVAGGLAGVHYGVSAVPKGCVDQMAESNNLRPVFDGFAAKTAGTAVLS
jgi:ADP-ribosyl-[dinitrogen reductase] hydrolase